ncbi:DNA polymerase III subunit beta [Nonomuraea recticatena]|uniref:DNA polymerase III beta sliding clamp N-terminal domain-containing protein n=1 Tax=Nonomuraea recticatena TaxID=46178 RepID=A0ABP6E494_9ACTN
MSATTGSKSKAKAAQSPAATKTATKTIAKGATKAAASTKPATRRKPKAADHAAPAADVQADVQAVVQANVQAVAQAVVQAEAQDATQTEQAQIREDATSAPEAQPEKSEPPQDTLTGFRVDRNEFARAVAWTARSLPAVASVPVLTGIRLDLADGQLRLSAFDYEVSAQAVIPATFEGSAQLLLPGKVLAEIVRALPAHPVDVAVKGAKVVVTCGPARFTLLTMPVEDYPNLPQTPPVIGRIDGAILATAAAQAAVAAGRDDTLPMLTGIRMEVSGDAVTLRPRIATGSPSAT